MNRHPRRLSLKREALTDLTTTDLGGIAAAANAATRDGKACTLVISIRECSLMTDCTSNTWMCTGGC